MSNSEQAQYIMQLPLSEFRAIQKAQKVLIRSGMHSEQALAIILESHSESKRNQRLLRN